MPLRPCLGMPGDPCGEPTPSTRCQRHTAAFESRRPPRRVKGRYDAKHNRLRAIVLREQPWCSECRTPGGEDNPLQADHIVPHQWGGKNVRSNYQTLCRRCNAAKRDRMLAGEKGDSRVTSLQLFARCTWDPLESTCRHASLSIL